MSVNYRQYWRLLRGQRGLYALAIGALALASCILYLEPLVSQVVLDGVLTRESPKASALVRSVVAFCGGAEGLRGRLWLAAGAVVLLTAAAGERRGGSGRRPAGQRP
jgi:hypothetical protein